MSCVCVFCVEAVEHQLQQRLFILVMADVNDIHLGFTLDGHLESQTRWLWISREASRDYFNGGSDGLESWRYGVVEARVVG